MIDIATADADLQQMRAAYEAMHAQFSPPPEIAVQPVNAGGVPSLLLGSQPEQSATLLHLHGGGYVLGSAFGYRPLAGALAAAAETTVLLPEYRLAPEHPFPAAVEDSVRAYQWILDSGAEPGQVTVSGDSAGGGLVLSLLLTLREQGLPLPGGAILLCPGVDLSGGTILDRVTSTVDIETARQQLERCAAAYLAGHPIDDPIVSPLKADLTGLPPMLVQAATGDLAVEDAHQITNRARSHGVDVRLELFPVETHVFQLFWAFLPEAADALRQAGEFAVARRSSPRRAADSL
jgi:acetyl esterase/lipase